MSYVESAAQHLPSTATATSTARSVTLNGLPAVPRGQRASLSWKAAGMFHIGSIRRKS